MKPYIAFMGRGIIHHRNFTSDFKKYCQCATYHRLTSYVVPIHIQSLKTGGMIDALDKNV